MTEQALRVERAVNELVYELPAGVASKDTVDEHMQLLVEDYGLSVDRAQAATRYYLTTSREGVADCLVSQLAQTSETSPTKDAVVADLEFLTGWRVPLEDASAVVRRKYDPADPADLNPADSDPDSTTGVPTGATDAEVAAAIPSLDDHEWSSTSDLADPDPDDQDILDADARETSDASTAPTRRRNWRGMIVARLASIVRIACRRLAEHRP